MFKNISLSLKITIAYLLFGILWILISDSLVNLFTQNIQQIQFIQLFKGWFFILLSAFIIYFVSKKQISDLQNAKDKTHESKMLLENIINNAPIRIFWKNKEGHYLGANKFFLQDMNLKNIEQLIGKTDRNLDVNEREGYIDDDSYIINNNHKKLNYIETLTTAQGKRKVLNTSKVPLLDQNNQVVGIIGVYQDITQQVEIEHQIKKQESIILKQSKFASMGEMIANIVHQWRQPLSVISTSATGMKIQKELGMSNEKFEIETLDVINENVQYLSATIDDFRNFFKEDKYKNKVYLNEVINKTLSLVSSRLKNKNITVITKCQDIHLETLETELIHTFINIINNAIDALETLEYEKYIFIEAQQQNDVLIVKIKDNAGGIDKNSIARVFEPYFTTKDSAHGTGIGLYMCKEIVVKHLYGKIDVKNVVFDYKDVSYRGAEFRVEILI